MVWICLFHLTKFFQILLHFGSGNESEFSVSDSDFAFRILCTAQALICNNNINLCLFLLYQVIIFLITRFIYNYHKHLHFLVFCLILNIAFYFFFVRTSLIYYSIFNLKWCNSKMDWFLFKFIISYFILKIIFLNDLFYLRFYRPFLK